MAGPSNIQETNIRARAFYEQEGKPPLLALICQAHGITIRDFAKIFGISKSHAAEIIAHRKLPDLELAVRICRYWAVTVEELFSWRIDDTGERRPLLVIQNGQVRKLVGKDRVGAIELGCSQK
jgi:DNA-binding XRE family transcriptional regulator